MSENRGLSLPGQQQRIPGVPEDTNIVAFEKFDGLNTKSNRVAIQASECSWLEGFMPVTDNNLRTLPGQGPNLYTASGHTIIYFSQFNIGINEYFFVLLSDGSAIQVSSGGVVTNIAPASTFAPTTYQTATASWGGQYLLIITSNNIATTNGYFIWDGTNLYEAGTIGPNIVITNGGLGYTTIPTVTLITTGSGTGTVLAAEISNGQVIKVDVTSPGSGYAIGDVVLVSFNGGNGTETCYGTASFNNGVIVNTTVDNPGSGYTSIPTITVTDATGTGASLVVGEASGGLLVSIQIVAGGINYTNPTISISGPGSGAVVSAELQSGVLTGTSITQAGLGYTGDTTVEFFAPTGTGAAAQAVLDHTTGAVTAVNLTQGGSGYSGNVRFVVEGPGPAAATAELMPFGINGTAIEVFQSRVWIANGAATQNQNRVIFTAAGDPADFNPDDGAGAFPSTDSFLRVGYHGLKQTNGFLYLIGDSSENTISGVQTNSPSSSAATSQVVTTFNNQNSDPQLGTPWPSSIQVFSRNLIFANRYGILVSLGGAVTKISQPLDGFYVDELSDASTTNYPSAVATIFGNLVYMLLIPVFDPFSSSVVNKLVMWDGKKFWTYPAASLTYIATQEVDSFLNAWATDGTNLFELFTAPTNTITKRFQTKLWIDPSYWTTKTAIRLSSIIAANSTPDGTITVTLDSEANSSSPTTITLNNTNPSINGPLPVGQQGRAIGMTLTTTCSDISIISLSMLTQVFSTNV